MNDTEFLAAFEVGALPHFPHRAHVRMAWLYLRAHGYDAGVTHICDGRRRRTARRKNITRRWVSMVYHAVQQSPDAADFEAFVAQHSDLLNTRLTDAYYRKETLWSAEARAAWVAPDFHAMPSDS